MAFLPTNAAQVQAFAGALYGIQAGTTTMAQVNADIAAVGSLNGALNAYYSASFGSLTTTSVANTLVANLGLTGTAATQGAAYVKGQLDAAAANARGAVISNILSLFGGLSNDSVYGAAATAWNAKLAAAVASNSASDVTFGSNVGVGQTFALTTGTNSFTGGVGADTFDAGLSTGSLQTLNSGDRLDGGAGTDELFAVINGSVTPAALTSVENVYVSSITNNATIDLTNATGLVKVVNQGSSTALTVSGIATNTAVTVQDTAIAGQTVTYTGVTGTADSATIGLQNVTGAATLTVGGIESLSLVTAGTTANVLANLTDANTTSLNVSGTSALNVTLTGAPAIRTIDASNLSAALTVTPTTALAATVTGGSGNDAITLNRVVNDSVSGGAGNDTITFTGAGTLTVADTISGGDGTADVLVGNITDLSALTSATVSLRTGFERITVSDAFAGGALTTANVQAGIERVTLAAATAGNATITMEAGDKTVALGAALSVGTLTVNDTGVATTDSLTVTNTAAATDVFGSRPIAVNGYETVTLTTSGTGAATAQNTGTVTLTPDGGTSTLNISGSNGITTGAITANVINASGLTGTAALTMGAAAVSVTSITGSINADTLVGDASSSIDGGAGNDTITGGTGNDTLLGGDGADTITTGGGAGDSVDGGAGNDIIVATLTAGNKMTGGDGTDVLSLAVAGTAASASGVSGFETLRATAAITQDMAVFLDNSTFTTLQGAVAGTSAFTNVGAGVTTLATTVAGNTSSVARLVDTSSNSLTVTLLGNAITTAITANDEETISLGTSSAVGATTLTTLTATDLHTLNITGSNAVTITTLAANSTTTGTVLTINASANTGGVTLSAANSTLPVSFTGSATAASSFTGGAGADTIVGGGVADTLANGGGADVMTGGAGADTFTVTATGLASTTGASHAASFVEITDFAKSSDILNFGAANIVSGSTAAAGRAAIATSGLATFNVADSTLALRVTAVEAGIVASQGGGATTNGNAAMFMFGSDAYVFFSDGTAGVGSGDLLVKLTGISVTTSTLTDGGTTFTIV